LISYCGSSGLHLRMCPLYSVSCVCFFLITPDTSPASEFHRTWSPTLNVLLIFPLLRKLQLLAQSLTYPALRHLPTGYELKNLFLFLIREVRVHMRIDNRLFFHIVLIKERENLCASLLNTRRIPGWILQKLF